MLFDQSFSYLLDLARWRARAFQDDPIRALCPCSLSPDASPACGGHAPERAARAVRGRSADPGDGGNPATSETCGGHHHDDG